MDTQAISIVREAPGNRETKRKQIMTNALRLGKKAFTWSVVLATIAWSVGIAALAAPYMANAAEDCPVLESGDLFTVPDNPAVYLLNADMERMYFPHSSVYHSWFSDFSGVVEIPTTCVANYPAPSVAPFGVNYGPGTLVKLTISDVVYVVLPGNEVAPIESEEVAIALFGADWASKVYDVADPFWPNLQDSGMTVDMAELQPGMNVMVDGVYYHVDGDGLVWEVEGDLNGAPVYEVDASLLGSVEGTTTSGDVLGDPSQLGGLMLPGPDGEPPVVVDGTLSVSLSPSTPSSANVPINVDNVTFARVNFTAGSDGDVTVNSFRIERNGLGATGDFTSVTAYDGATKLGSTRTSWHSDGYMTYNVAGGWTIPAGMTKELTLVGKLDTAGTYNSLGLSQVGVSGDVDVSGLPVDGNEMSGVSVTVGQVTLDGVGSNSTKNIGSTDVTLGKVKLTMNGVEDAELRSLTLKNKAGTSNASDRDLGNISLWLGSEMVAGPVEMNSDKVVFELDIPHVIKKSKNETFTIKGDIVNGDGNTVEFLLDDATDINMVGHTYNTNLTVASGLFDTAGTDGAVITIDGAELNVGYTGSNLDTQNDRTDVEFGRITFSAGSTDIKITEIDFTIDETAASGETSVFDIDEFELVNVDDGGAYSGTESTGSDANAADETWTFTDEIYLTAGEAATFVMRGDIPAGVSSTASYRVTHNTTNITAETVPEGDSVDNFSIGSFTGKTVTVQAPTLTIKGVTQNVGEAVTSEEGVLLYQGTAKANLTDDIHVTSFQFGNSAQFSTDNWNQVSFYTIRSGEWVLEETLTSNDMSSTTNVSVVDFDNLDFTIPAGTTYGFGVKGNTAGTFNSNTNADLDLDLVAAKDSDNDDAVVTGPLGTENFLTDGTNFTEGRRNIDLKATGALIVSMRDIDTGFNKDRILLAGDDAWVGKLRLRAEFEDILLKDLKFYNSSAGDENSVASEGVCLYTEQVASAANLVACTSLGTDRYAFFDDINVQIEEGTHDWFINVQSASMGDAALATAATSDLIQFKVASTSDVVAEGWSSKNALGIANRDSTVDTAEIVFDSDLDGTFDEAPDYETTNTKQFDIAGSKIEAVSFVSSYGGETVDDTISGTGEYTLAIMKIETADHSNTDANGDALKLALTNLVFDVEKFGSTTIGVSNIQRIGGVSGAVALNDNAVNGASDNGGTNLDETSGDWTLVATNTTNLGDDRKISAGDTAYFVIKTNVTGLNATTGVVDWIRLDLDNLGTRANQTNNNIDWDDGYTAGKDFDYTNLDVQAITGTKVDENL